MSAWIKFLRHYGPGSRIDSMYDETVQRSSRRLKIKPINFAHPEEQIILKCFDKNPDPTSVILTGTAGDGKTHLCRQVWNLLSGTHEEWESDSPHLILNIKRPLNKSVWPETDDPRLYEEIKIHFIRDLSGWAPQQGAEWEPAKEILLQSLCVSLINPNHRELFLLAANDGQLVESFRRLKQTDEVKKACQIIEDFLVEECTEQKGIRLRFFNLSRTSSAELFERAIEALVAHPGWAELLEGAAAGSIVFGSRCPIRKNYELLQSPLVRSRIKALLELCDYNGLHVPIRQILLLLTNSLLGHPDAKEHLMSADDVAGIIASGTTSKASLYNNIFGGNLSDIRRQTVTIFHYLEKFQIGYETSNRVDNMLIFGQDDEHLGAYFQQFVASDDFYGADDRFYAAKREYIEGTNEGEDKSTEFLQMLISQRRGLFFKIPRDSEIDLKLWELTVFKFAGEYLDQVVNTLVSGSMVKRPILSRLVRGLNRVFTGMLINSDRELFLATSGNYSQSKVSRILVEKVSVEPSKGEKIFLYYNKSKSKVFLSVYFSADIFEEFSMSLIRFEFLSRIASDGALPASFSKECYEDLLAFKSRLIAAFLRRQSKEPVQPSSVIGIHLLALTDQGTPDPKHLEIVR